MRKHGVYPANIQQSCLRHSGSFSSEDKTVEVLVHQYCSRLFNVGRCMALLTFQSRLPLVSGIAHTQSRKSDRICRAKSDIFVLFYFHTFFFVIANKVDQQAGGALVAQWIATRPEIHKDPPCHEF
ncbi:hypothetical protein PoB_003884900 [Plakobranchus ocellatus]|uniref:Uncharacterized protein n=1 Tax=Plakobranchus ocellatus TaxID=259542 RepID=A0AAV4B1V3_9GAST|nr:hypothetical protein PoB_003884900 [Plakobranchus ocellatus]